MSASSQSTDSLIVPHQASILNCHSLMRIIMPRASGGGGGGGGAYTNNFWRTYAPHPAQSSLIFICYDSF